MKASAIEYRFRLILSTVIVLLGFWAPWIEWLHLGTRSTTWLWLGFQLGGFGVPATTAIEIVTIATILIAAKAAFLRVWGSAYLGPATVWSSTMQAADAPQTSRLIADGPYRYVRNPLYWGSLLMNLAIATLMPPTGALVSFLLMTAFVFRLILAEEDFLAKQFGDQYAAYRQAVPRLFPNLLPGRRQQIHSVGQKPAWVRALAAELLPVGVLISFAALSWQYNSDLLIRALLVSFGVSLVARALIAPGGEVASS